MRTHHFTTHHFTTRAIACLVIALVLSSAMTEARRRQTVAAAVRAGADAIQEWGDMLTGAFRRWRQMKDGTEEARIEKRQLEQSILFIAGVLAHWVTDVSQPMHCSVHILGWHPSVANPLRYTADRGIHGRYETEYVERAIAETDVRSALTQHRPAELSDWLTDSGRDIGACNSHVETIYRWHKQTPFGSGREPADAKPFTAARLADGAAMLRDTWVTAWRRSATQP